VPISLQFFDAASRKEIVADEIRAGVVSAHRDR
jgi:hypothetical protein